MGMVVGGTIPIVSDKDFDVSTLFWLRILSFLAESEVPHFAQNVFSFRSISSSPKDGGVDLHRCIAILQVQESELSVCKATGLATMVAGTSVASQKP